MEIRIYFTSSTSLVGALHWVMVAFPTLVWNLAVTALDYTVFQPMSDLAACGVSMNPIPSA